MTAGPFSDRSEARIFALPMGTDFSAELVAGLAARMAGHPPEELGRVELIVNTTRMRRRLRSLYTQRGAGFLPRIRLLTELGLPTPDGPASKLARRLEIAQLVRALLDREPKLAPRTAIFDLAQSLQKLLDEIESEGVPLSALQEVDVGQLSAHWTRSLTFINIIAPFLSEGPHSGPEARQRARIVSLITAWQENPPAHPILLAGSTGSRGTTALLMEAVTRLPQGAVILPGFDFQQPTEVWDTLDDALTAEDHPQYRFAKLLKRLGLHPDHVQRWTEKVPAVPSRNALVSLALRPAPVTNQWLSEGPKLQNISDACAGISLLEAPSARIEAQAIALCLRKAAEAGKTAALVTPDRVLGRQVTAALDRWRIEPDDSAGRPLSLSPPGRLLRQVADALGQKTAPDVLIALLKHPLTLSTPETRGSHLLLTRALELDLRRKRLTRPDAEGLLAWSQARPEPEASNWGKWLSEIVTRLQTTSGGDLTDAEATHRVITVQLAAGSSAYGTGGLWDLAAGEEAFRAMESIAEAAPLGGIVTLAEYRALLDSVLQDTEVRDPRRAHPNIMIWGTLEARVQTVDLAILAGLNDGIWPPLPAADPWMNRVMRAQAGLLLPERQIGLSAHDFQQGIGAREVVLSRALRGDEAETIPSRWLNRLTNLLAGVSAESEAELKAMRARGTALIKEAERLDLPHAAVTATARPSPKPPVAHRPDELPVTAIEALVRDPYSVYARHILRLRPLTILGQPPDARDRGSLFHKVMEEFVPGLADGAYPLAADTLRNVAADVISKAGFDPGISAFWRAHLDRIAEDLVSREEPRLRLSAKVLTETRGSRATVSGFRLTCRADRVDLGKDGKLRIYDYKSTPPSEKQVKVFDFQLHLEAAIAEAVGIADLGPHKVDALGYLSLSASAKDLQIALGPDEAAEIWDQFCAFIAHWQSQGAGYTARRMMKSSDDPSDYDHLSRHGEWDITDPARPEDVG